MKQSEFDGFLILDENDVLESGHIWIHMNQWGKITPDEVKDNDTKGAGLLDGKQLGSTPSYYDGRYHFYQRIGPQKATRYPMNPHFSEPLPLP